MWLSSGNQLVDGTDDVVIGDQFIHLPFFHGSGVCFSALFTDAAGPQQSEVAGGDSSSQLINGFFGGKFASMASQSCRSLLRLAGLLQRLLALETLIQSPNIFESSDFGRIECAAYVAALSVGTSGAPADLTKQRPAARLAFFISICILKVKIQ